MKRLDWEEVSDYRGLVDAATESILAVWAASSRRISLTKGHPSKSSGFLSGGISCWDDLEDAVDAHVAASADAAIHSLSEIHRRVIMAIWTGSRFPAVDDPQLALLEAVAAFEQKARAKGIL